MNMVYLLYGTAWNVHLHHYLIVWIEFSTTETCYFFYMCSVAGASASCNTLISYSLSPQKLVMLKPLECYIRLKMSKPSVIVFVDC